jgi:hypothetical protein
MLAVTNGLHDMPHDDSLRHDIMTCDEGRVLVSVFLFLDTSNFLYDNVS